MNYSLAMDSLADLRRFFESRQGLDYIHFRTKELYETVRHYSYNDQFEKILLTTVGTIQSAEPFYWSPQMSDLLAQARNGIEHWALELDKLPVKSGYFFFHNPIPLEFLTTVGRKYAKGISWVETSISGVPGALVTFWKVYENNMGMLPQMDISYAWEDGKTVKEALAMRVEDVEALKVPDYLRVFGADEERFTIFAAAMALINQRLIAVKRERATRNTLKRSQQFVGTPDVLVVNLRKFAQGHHVSSDQPVDWQFRWFVRGHWRHQYYPSKGEHKSIFILPYVKGPEEKPLKAEVDRIFNVAR